MNVGFRLEGAGLRLQRRLLSLQEIRRRSLPSILEILRRRVCGLGFTFWVQGVGFRAYVLWFVGQDYVNERGMFPLEKEVVILPPHAMNGCACTGQLLLDVNHVVAVAWSELSCWAVWWIRPQNVNRHSESSSRFRFRVDAAY